MEDQHHHDLYFSWPDLVADPFPEEIYLSWRDLVGKPDPEEIYFSWDDIMGDLYLKQDSHLQTPLLTNLASFKNSSYKSSADSDEGDSRWDDTESNLSFGLHSAAGSCSTNTSERAHETRDNYTEEGQLLPDSCQSLDSEESDNNTSAGKELCGKLDTDVNSEEIVPEVLTPIRMGLVDQVMEEFWVMFNQGWSFNFTDHADNSSAGTSRSSNVEETNHDTGARQPSRGKRQREEGNAGDQNGDRNSRTPGKRSSGGKDSEESIKFACPFRKHDPRKYNIYSHRTCTLSHWDTISRLKEHLYRCHQIEIHCTRCWQIFKNQQELDTHLRVASANICPLVPGHAPDGITPEQEKRLRSKKKSHSGQSDESRWTDIYKLLFPNEEAPLPYFERLQDKAPLALSPDSRNLANYEEYLRRELPLMVRSEIEEAVRREMQPYRDTLIGNLVGIIQDCQDRVFHAYREGLDMEVDMRLPSSVDADDAHDCEPLQSHPSQRQNIPKLQEESDFLDAVFNFPPPIQDTGGFLEPFDMHNQNPSFSANDHVFSDSGYASGMLCNCPNPSSCSTTSISSSSNWCVSQGDNESEGTFPWQLGSFDISSGLGRE